MEITKEELLAYTEAATKTATALEKIADRLVDLSSQQRDCHDKFCSALLEMVKTNHMLLLSIDKKTEDLTWLKWLWTSIASIVGIGWIVLKIIGHA